MPAAAVKQARNVIGLSPDRLTLEEQIALAGQYVAFEIYTPEALPLRRIEAIGDTVEACIRQLAARGLDPLRFEFTRLPAPF